MKQIFNNEDIKELKRLLKASNSVVLTGHVRPDGDAIGSTLGLYHLLREMGKQAVVMVPDTPPRTLSFLPGFKDIAVYTRHDPYCQRLVDEADLIVCCDFNSLKRLDHLGALIEKSTCPRVMIDHHQDPDMDCVLRFSYPNMSSTCELMFRILAAAGFYDVMSRESAECLLTGIETDTKNFRVNCQDPEIFDVVKYLMEKGVDRLKIAKEAVFTSSFDSLRIKSFAIAERMEIFPSHRCAVITLGKEDLKRFNYERGDTEGLVDMPLEIKGVVYSVFMREDNDCIKVSARSCAGFPVSDICRDLYGGGGHIMAAGGEFYGSLEECRDILVRNMVKYDKKLPIKFPKIDLGTNSK